MSAALGASALGAPAGDLRHEVELSRRRLRRTWGLLIAVLAVLLWRFSGGFFLLAAAAVGTALALSWLFTVLGVLGLDVRRSLSATEIPYGGAVEARLALHNRKDWPAPWLLWRDQIDPGLDVEGVSSDFRSLKGGGTAELGYRLHSTRRGLFRIGPAVVEASDPFGLVRRFHVDREPVFLTVLPRSLALDRARPASRRPIHEVPRRRSLFEDPTRFLGVRDYRRGDPLQRIHWRATARSGKLQVKLFEPAVLDGVLLAIEMSAAVLGDPADGPSAAEELAVTAAASVADLVLGAGQAVALISNGADAAEAFAGDWTGGTFRRLDQALAAAEPRRKVTAPRPVEVAAGKGAWQRQRLHTALARLVRARGPGLPELLHVELPRLPRSLVLMVLTPRLDAALAGVLGELHRSGIDVAVAWIGARGGAAAAALPRGVAVYPVADEHDLMVLGSRPL
jgi:uncharacterized protein (DUF58 family)